MDDYLELLDRLNTPPAAVWLPVCEWDITHNPPDDGSHNEWNAERLLRTLPAANRTRLVLFAYALLDDTGVPGAFQPVGPGATLDYRVLERTVLACAGAFQVHLSQTREPGEPFQSAGRLFPPIPPHLIRRAGVDYHSNEYTYYPSWHGYFLYSWMLGVQQLAPIRLPLVRPTLEGFLQELPKACRKRWRIAIKEHFARVRGTELARTPSVRELGGVLLHEWRESQGISAGDILDLVELLRRYGIDPAEDEVDRDGRRETRDGARPEPVSGGGGRGMFTCPVCGYLGLHCDPLDTWHWAICTCCGTAFGCDDSGRTHDELRSDWLQAGARWSHPEECPADWTAEAQLDSAGLTVPDA